MRTWAFDGYGGYLGDDLRVFIARHRASAAQSRLFNAFVLACWRLCSAWIFTGSISSVSFIAILCPTCISTSSIPLPHLPAAFRIVNPLSRMKCCRASGSQFVLDHVVIVLNFLQHNLLLPTPLQRWAWNTIRKSNPAVPYSRMGYRWKCDMKMKHTHVQFDELFVWFSANQ